MSQENVEIVRRIYEAYERRDAEAPYEFYAPDIEWDLSESEQGLGPAEVYHGHEGVRASFRDVLAAFREYELVPESAQDLGNKVLVVVRERAVGRRSEAAGERRHYALWTLRDGKVIRMRVYHDRSDAIHAAEPEDQAVSANVHLVRSIYADWERGDWSSADWADPRVEFVAADGPWAGSFIGKPAMARAWRQYLDAWEDVRASPDEFRDLGDGRVLALHTWSARGKASGLAVERMQARSAVLLHVADGKVRKLVAYQDRDRALADLGQE